MTVIISADAMKEQAKKLVAFKEVKMMGYEA